MKDGAGARPRLVGREQPRLFTPPLRELTPDTSLGFDCIDFALEVLGISLFPWQRWLLIHMLELRTDGMLRFRKVIVLVARQNGKTLLAEVLALYFMYALGARLVLGTAQDLGTAEDVWQDTLDLAAESDLLAPLLTKPKRGKGSKEFGLADRGVYRVKAANRRGGRGARQVKLVLLDELREHQSWDAWGAITKTTNAVPEALILALSNAGDVASLVLRYLRLMAHKSLGDPDGVCAAEDPTTLLDETGADSEDYAVDDDDDSLGLFEWSAPPGCDVHDRDGWAQANPSLPHTVTERVIASDARTDPEWVFRTEVLCQWSSGSLVGPFPPGTWDAGREPTSCLTSDAPVTLCVDVSWDRSWSHIALSGHREDGLLWVELVASRAGTDWIVGWLTSAERQERVRSAPVVIQAAGAPVSSLADDLREGGVNVVEWKGSDLTAATGAFYDGVRDGVIRHAAWPALDIAAATAVPKVLDGGAILWDRKRSPNDAAPLIAATGAAWFAKTREPDYDLLASVW